MKILFISSGNVHGGISPVVLSQGKSLGNEGVEIDFFTINGKGIWGYFKNIFRLRSHLRKKNYDIFHAHYWLSGIVSFLAGAKPLVVSIMGTEARTGKLSKTVIRYFSKKLWDHTIVKSARIKEELRLTNVSVIPNGIDLNLFRPIPQDEARIHTGLTGGRIILFASDPSRYEKNYNLAEESVRRAEIPGAKLIVVSKKPHHMIPFYMNAGDVLLLTSLWEGSPNVVKEAMACGLAIVSTDTGDVRELTVDTEGCFITGFDPDEIAEKLKLAVLLGKRTNGREKIKNLDERVIAQKLTGLYTSVIKN